MHASEVSGKLFEQLNFRGERQKEYLAILQMLILQNTKQKI